MDFAELREKILADPVVRDVLPPVGGGHDGVTFVFGWGQYNVSFTEGWGVHVVNDAVTGKLEEVHVLPDDEEGGGR